MKNLELNFLDKNGYIKYPAKKNISLSFSKNLIQSRQNYFDSSPIHTLNTILINEGILLVYFVKTPLSFGVALFDKKYPKKLLWRSVNPIWKTHEKLQPLKVEKKRDSLIIYFKNRKENLQKIVIPLVYIFEDPRPVLERALKNPILNPIPEHLWETKGTFNAATIFLEGKVHLLYRAIGEKGNSVLGYATSKEGVNIDERLDYPVYSHKFMSGDGYGSCEDPRLTKLDDKLYMTYTAFNECNPPSVVLSSINVKDFLEKKWKWEKPTLLSPPGEIHKNWVIFPEKINGKYAILHSISPKIQIDYFDSLEFKNCPHIKSFHCFASRKNCWDNMVKGAGPPPINTEAGWLVIYHAINKQDPSRYKLGAMILDHDNPTKIMYRSSYPILEPDAKYENEGFKAGIVYACGAIVIDKQLFIYYGGADTVTCVATINLNQFLNKLKSSKPIKLEYV